MGLRDFLRNVTPSSILSMKYNLDSKIDMAKYEARTAARSVINEAGIDYEDGEKLIDGAKHIVRGVPSLVKGNVPEAVGKVVGGAIRDSVKDKN